MAGCAFFHLKCLPAYWPTKSMPSSRSGRKKQAVVVIPNDLHLSQRVFILYDLESLELERVHSACVRAVLGQ